MKIIGNQWKSLKIHRKSMKIIRKSIRFNENHWKTNGKSMEIAFDLHVISGKNGLNAVFFMAGRPYLPLIACKCAWFHVKRIEKPIENQCSMIWTEWKPMSFLMNFNVFHWFSLIFINLYWFLIDFLWF